MNRPHDPRYEELLPAYALGALDGEDLLALEEHLATDCAECQRQLDLWQGDLEEIAAAVPPVEPSAETRARVLRIAEGGRILSSHAASPAASAASHAPAAAPSATPPVRTRGTSSPWPWLAMAAALVIAIASLWRQAGLSNQLERVAAQRDRIAREAAALDQQLGLARAETQRLSEALSVIAAPGSRAVQLAGLGSAPRATGRTFVDGEKAVFYAFDLPPLPADKTYQLWWIGPGAAPVPAGTFEPDSSGRATLRVDRVRPAEGQIWAVTVEPEGGVPQPTGEMVLKS